MLCIRDILCHQLHHNTYRVDGKDLDPGGMV